MIPYRCSCRHDPSSLKSSPFPVSCASDDLLFPSLQFIAPMMLVALSMKSCIISLSGMVQSCSDLWPGRVKYVGEGGSDTERQMHVLRYFPPASSSWRIRRLEAMIELISHWSRLSAWWNNVLPASPCIVELGPFCSCFRRDNVEKRFESERHLHHKEQPRLLHEQSIRRKRIWCFCPFHMQNRPRFSWREAACMH